jgi:hypothetical protein
MLLMRYEFLGPGTRHQVILLKNKHIVDRWPMCRTSLYMMVLPSCKPSTSERIKILYNLSYLSGGDRKQVELLLDLELVEIRLV